MSKRNLYVLSSVHFSDTDKLSLEEQKQIVGPCLKVRQSIISAIGSGLGRCTYFSDGLNKDTAAEMREVIDDHLDQLGALGISDPLKAYQFIRRFYDLVGYDGEDDNPAHYDYDDMIAFFAASRVAGIDFRITETEAANCSELDADREDGMSENVHRLGSKENILFVGHGHPLKKLLASEEFDSYRVEIRRRAQAVLVYGEMPYRFIKVISGELAGYSKDFLDNQLKFVKR